MAKVVLYDPREKSPTKGYANEFHIGILNPMLIKIPLLVYHGFTAAGNQPALQVARGVMTAYNNYHPEMKGLRCWRR